MQLPQELLDEVNISEPLDYLEYLPSAMIDAASLNTEGKGEGLIVY